MDSIFVFTDLSVSAELVAIVVPLVAVNSALKFRLASLASFNSLAFCIANVNSRIANLADITVMSCIFVNFTVVLMVSVVSVVFDGFVIFRHLCSFDNAELVGMSGDSVNLNRSSVVDSFNRLVRHQVIRVCGSSG